MLICTICKECEVEWTWQPLGPDDNTASLALPGLHFPVLNVCDVCKANIEAGNFVAFTYQGVTYHVLNGVIEILTDKGLRTVKVNRPPVGAFERYVEQLGLDWESESC